MSMRSPTPDVSLNGEEMPFSHLVSDTQPQRSVSPFASGFTQTFEKDHPDSDPPVSPRGSQELNTGRLNDFETSGFDALAHEPSLRLPDVLELEQQLKQAEDCVLSKGKSEVEEPLSAIGEDVELKPFQSSPKGDDPQKTEEMEMRCVSPCSSIRSNFSDSIAARFVNSNFNNPQYFEEEPTEVVSRTPLGGSIRHRYTMRRLQSMLSRRSTLSPSVDGRTTPGRIPPTSTMRSRRSVGPSMSKRWSFRSRDESGGGGPQLSNAYSFIRLETCIRKAWHLSTNNEAIEEDVPSMKKQTKPMRSELKSIKKQFSRKPDREAEVSFVHVPLNPENRFLGAQEEVVLNPYYGDDTPLDEDGSSEGGNTIDANSVVLRTPLQRIGPIDENYTRCEKNLEEGLYDNPLELCSFRSYDSDTELELTSFRFRNPISKLLDLDRVRGVSKDGIALAELEGNDCSLAMLKEVGKCPIQESMMDKYLTQLVINDAIEEPSNEAGGWATCQEEMVPQELDSDLRCFLLERFLLDNVSHEMDVNLEAMELARVQQRRPPSGSRKLRRS